MKSSGHPTYYAQAKISCACGNSFISGSTKQEIKVDVCSKCHPLYTGEQRFLDVKGRVDTFQKKQQVAKQYKATLATKKSKKDEKSEKNVKSLKELLIEN